jgi:glucose uptake protein GlcU
LNFNDRKSQSQDHFNLGEKDIHAKKAIQQREIGTAWLFLSAPIVGFVAYLVQFANFKVGDTNTLLFLAVALTVLCLFFLSWTFIVFTDADWRKTARFIATGLLFEGVVLFTTRTTGHEASFYFGFGSIVFGLLILFGAKKN